MNTRNNEAMSTEDFLRQVVFNNGGRGGEMDFRRSMGMPVADREAQGRSAVWNEADHPRDDIGQFTFKEGGTGHEKRGRVLLASADGKSAPQDGAAQSASQKRGGTFPSPEPEHGPLWGEVGDKMFDIYVANYEKFRPAWETMEKHTGVPVAISAVFAMNESDIGMNTKSATNVSGIMQVTGIARQAVEKMKEHSPALLAEIKQKYGDETLYYGPMYLRHVADIAGVDLKASDMAKTASGLNLSYTIGPYDARKLNRLAPTDPVSMALGGKAISANKAILKEGDRAVTRSKAEANSRGKMARSWQKIGEVAREADRRAGR